MIAGKYVETQAVLLSLTIVLAPVLAGFLVIAWMLLEHQNDAMRQKILFVSTLKNRYAGALPDSVTL